MAETSQQGAFFENIIANQTKQADRSYNLGKMEIDQRAKAAKAQAKNAAESNAIDRWKAEQEVQLAQARLAQEQDQFTKTLDFNKLGSEEEKRQFNATLFEDTRQFDATLSQKETQFAQTLTENARQFGETLGQRESEFLRTLNQNQSQFSQTFGENQRQFNQTFGENQRQFNVGATGYIEDMGRLPYEQANGLRALNAAMQVRELSPQERIEYNLYSKMARGQTVERDTLDLNRAKLGYDVLNMGAQLTGPDKVFEAYDFNRGVGAREDTPMFLQALRDNNRLRAFGAQGGAPTPLTTEGLAAKMDPGYGASPEALATENALATISDIGQAGAHKLAPGALEQLNPSEYKTFLSGLGKAGFDRASFLSDYRKSRIGNQVGAYKVA